MFFHFPYLKLGQGTQNLVRENEVFVRDNKLILRKMSTKCPEDQGICLRYRIFEISRVNRIRLDILENSRERKWETDLVPSSCLSSFSNFFQLPDVSVISKSFFSLALRKYLKVTLQSKHAKKKKKKKK